MGSIKLVIRKEQVNSKGLCTIFVLYTHKGYNKYFSTKEQIPIKNWDFKNNRVKSNYRGYTTLNEILFKKRHQIEEVRMKLVLKDLEPTVERIKSEFDKSLKPTAPKLSFLQILDQFIEFKKESRTVSSSSLKQYKSFRKKLSDFQEVKKKKISISSVNKDFYREFIDYLELELDMKANTAGNHIKHLKCFLKWVEDYEIAEISKDYKKFKKPKSDATIISLTQDEFDTLWNFKFESKSLEKVRDSFCLSCATGLRYSDYKLIKSDNIVEERNEDGSIDKFIVKYMQKTKKPILIPLNSYSDFILKKYNYDLKALSNQKVNLYIKNAAKKAGLTKKIQIMEEKGRVKKVLEKPLFEAITSHVGRKTFATLSLNKGMPPTQVMAITGHKSYQSFQRYVGLDKRALSASMREKWAF